MAVQRSDAEVSKGLEVYHFISSRLLTEEDTDTWIGIAAPFVPVVPQWITRKVLDFLLPDAITVILLEGMIRLGWVPDPSSPFERARWAEAGVPVPEKYVR